MYCLTYLISIILESSYLQQACLTKAQQVWAHGTWNSTRSFTLMVQEDVRMGMWYMEQHQVHHVTLSFEVHHVTLRCIMSLCGTWSSVTYKLKSHSHEPW